MRCLSGSVSTLFVGTGFQVGLRVCLSSSPAKLAPGSCLNLLISGIKVATTPAQLSKWVLGTQTLRLAKFLLTESPPQTPQFFQTYLKNHSYSRHPTALASSASSRAQASFIMDRLSPFWSLKGFTALVLNGSQCGS